MKKILSLLSVLITAQFLFAQSTSVRFLTSKGNFTVMLYDATPEHRDLLLNAVRQGWYKNAQFNRVIKGFVSQGGELDDDILEREKKNPGTRVRIPAEFPVGVFHKKYSLGQGRDGNPEKGSFQKQLYLVDGRTYTDTELDAIEKKKNKKFSATQREIYKTIGGTPQLDGDYTIFGEITEGMNTADSINSVSTGKNDMPLSPVVFNIEIIHNEPVKTIPVIKNNVVLKISPGAGNPRNSEGAFVTLKDGKILFIYSHYTSGTGGDHDPAYLASRISSDHGKSWTTNDKIVLANEGGMNVMSVSLLRLKNGEIALFYLRKNSTTDCIPYVRFSKDEGKSWSDAISCIKDQKGYFVLNNDRVIQLKNGRLLMAVALHKDLNGRMARLGNLFSYYSDDNGRNWHAGKEVGNPAGIITQEPGVVELKNGHVMMFIRASGGVQLVAYSSDQGQTWSDAVAYNLKSPLSPASIKRIPKTGDLIAVWNNNDGRNPSSKNHRTPLTIAISKDEGKTWNLIKNLEVDPDGWYCYTAIHFDKDNVLLGYCAGSQKQKTHLSVIDIALLSLKYCIRNSKLGKL